MNLQYDGQITIAHASSCKATKWRNVQTTWGALLDDLMTTTRTSETFEDYMRMTKDEQGRIKDVGGFVAGYLRDGLRRNANIEYRQVVFLDADFAPDLDFWIDFGLLNMAGCLYTTHKHNVREKGGTRGTRARLGIPLSRPVNPEEYEACARVIANYFNMDIFDDTTYQAVRLMYYPSTSKDGVFVGEYIDAPWADPDELLAELPNWRDPTTWPVSSRVTELRRISADKAEDPTKKTGVVGAFCRAYSIEDAIGEFLPDIYSECATGAGRYTLEGGSTAGGLITYAGLYAYSHHATDVASGRLCNAFDLVRLHKFNHLDREGHEYKDPTKAPSYKAMQEFACNLNSVKLELLQARRTESANDYGDDYQAAEVKAVQAVTPGDMSWVKYLTMIGNSNNAESTIDNAVRVIDNDTALKGRLMLNRLTLRECVVKPFPWDYNRVYPRRFEDADTSQIRRYLERNYGIKGKDIVSEAVIISAQENGYHPLLDWADALPEWNGEPLLDTLLIRLFGAEDTPYTRAVTRKTFVAAMARIYNPGIKFDHVLVLIGEQGTGKSTFLQRMGGEFYTDGVSLTTDDKNNLELMRGKWILEVAELRGFAKAEMEFVKGFITRRIDTYRRPYKAYEIEYPRQSIFIGTHNKTDFLNDETGNRRFWPVDINTKEGEGVMWGWLTPEIVTQLWAEAKYYMLQGETLYLPHELEATAGVVQHDHREVDAWEEDILEYIKDKDEVRYRELWEQAIIGNHPMNKAEQNRIRRIMLTATKEWEYKKTRRAGGIDIRLWRRKITLFNGATE